MEIIAFDIRGKMAHFRKYYANNTAFSYSLPPRTTVMGMLAGMLGLPRESYHDAFALDKIRIAVRILNPVKKTFHRVNFLRVESLGDVMKDNLGDFTGRDGRIQTPFETVSGLDLTQDWVTYRIYLSCYEAGQELFETLKSQLKSGKKHYNLSLGTANFSAQLLHVRTYTASVLPRGEFVPIYTVPSAQILLLDSQQMKEVRFEEELLPLDFVKNGSRELKTIQRFLFSTNGKPFYAQLRCSVFQIIENQQVINFLFLEK